MYNIPGRSVVNMSIETQGRLAQLPRIVGVKDATGDLTRVKQTLYTCKASFTQLTGEDALVLPFMEQGGHGVISVTSNIAPGLCSALYNAWAKGDRACAQALHQKLMPLHEAMFCETSPGPVKFAAQDLGICQSVMRLPMVPIAKTSRIQVRAAMTRVKLPHLHMGGE
jgi:4-hydroxy-tetrahydrodipicolinate synthase